MISDLKSQIDELRGAEGLGSATYFAVFSLLLKQQREDFTFTTRSRRPPRDRVNCLLSFLYALVRHDCIAAPRASAWIRLSVSCTRNARTGPRWRWI